jgi:UPF0271 protein
MRSIDLNVDVGEGGRHDEALVRLASSANIACGGHAGNEHTIRTAMAAAIAAGAKVGAHPGYEDRDHFGRRPLDLPAAEVAAMMERQLVGFARLATEAGVAVDHVKPHGALYHQADASETLARLVLAAVRDGIGACRLIAPPGGWLGRLAEEFGLIPVAEGFADRRYGADGRLVPRGEPGAVIEDPEAAACQALGLAGTVGTLCVHGDGLAALRVLAGVRSALEADGWRISAGEIPL